VTGTPGALGCGTLRRVVGVFDIALGPRENGPLAVISGRTRERGAAPLPSPLPLLDPLPRSWGVGVGVVGS
jgi:hypothetical protein